MIWNAYGVGVVAVPVLEPVRARYLPLAVHVWCMAPALLRFESPVANDNGGVRVR